MLSVIISSPQIVLFNSSMLIYLIINFGIIRPDPYANVRPFRQRYNWVAEISVDRVEVVAVNSNRQTASDNHKLAQITAKRHVIF